VEKNVEETAASHLDHTRGQVDAGLRVSPFGARFVLHGRGQIERNKVGQRAGVSRGFGIGFAKP